MYRQYENPYELNKYLCELEAEFEFEADAAGLFCCEFEAGAFAASSSASFSL